jgi:hypothetical protein
MGRPSRLYAHKRHSWRRSSRRAEPHYAGKLSSIARLCNGLHRRLHTHTGSTNTVAAPEARLAASPYHTRLCSIISSQPVSACVERCRDKQREVNEASPSARKVGCPDPLEHVVVVFPFPLWRKFFGKSPMLDHLLAINPILVDVHARSPSSVLMTATKTIPFVPTRT